MTLPEIIISNDDNNNNVSGKVSPYPEIWDNDTWRKMWLSIETSEDDIEYLIRAELGDIDISYDDPLDSLLRENGLSEYVNPTMQKKEKFKLLFDSLGHAFAARLYIDRLESIQSPFQNRLDWAYEIIKEKSPKFTKDQMMQLTNAKIIFILELCTNRRV